MRTRWLTGEPHGAFLQQLILPRDLAARWHCMGSTRCAATVTVPHESEQDGRNGDQPSNRIRRVDDRFRVSELLGASTEEYSLRMSMSSGVSLFEPGLPRNSSFGELRHQADVNSGAKVGMLTVDQEQHRRNYRLWIELLHLRQRLDGVGGVLDIWYGMKRRNVDLPTEGEEAGVLWEELIRAASARTDNPKARNVGEELLDHAKDIKERTGKQYRLLYKNMVGQAFRSDLAAASYWHRKMVGSVLDVPNDALKQVGIDALRNPYHLMTFKTFKRMYNQSRERDCYDSIVLEAVRIQGTEHALKWHRLFMHNGDAPSTDIFATPPVQQLFDLDKDASLPVKLRTRPKVLSAIALGPREQPIHAPLTRAAMSTLVGDVHGIKPKGASDAFIAKMFATRAFSIDLVIRGLGFFAVDTLGPLAVREMALRAGSCVELCNRLQELKTAGIKISDCAYTRLVQKLAGEGHTELFSALMDSDQHPEGYDDTQTQEALLVSQLSAGNWAQAHVTMTCLNLAGVALKRRAINRLAQHYLSSRCWRLAAQTIETMRLQKVAMTSATIADLQRYVLSQRRGGRRPVESQRTDRPPFDALMFVTNAYMYSHALKSNIYSRAWVELMKRYGMAFQWHGLAKLVLWLAERRASRHLTIRRVRGHRTVLIRRPGLMDEIFVAQMQQAIFTWGFNAAAVRGHLRPQDGGIGLQKDESRFGALQDLSLNVTVSPHPPWTQGLQLLRHLKRRGLVVRDSVVRSAFYTRMWILFGPGYSTKPLNEHVRDRNRLSLADYIRQGNAAYDGLLVPELNPQLLLDDSPGEAVLKLAFFGRHG
ncbi:hypothetical protein LTR53_007590 [Teratosphaeriaceae sp. CCFEE 6253]|nr:hypothetical protein LTR53_007590 [Teratosphaeriaceae sp. CCFEE 6253]